MVTSAQLRAARAMLKLSAADVATGADVAVSTVQRAEASPGYPAIGARNLGKIEAFLRTKGAIFEAGATRLSEHQ
jgi:hypothetical protein